MKVCRKCKTNKTESEFYADKFSRDGYRCYCKVCQKQIAKLDYDKEAYQLKYALNKEAILTKHKQWGQQLNGRFTIYKARAKRKNIAFNLSIDEFTAIVSKSCYYCGEFSKNKNFCGIDRLDSNNSYVIDNCVSCCKECNIMKNILSKEEFFFKIKRIFENIKRYENY